LLYFKFGKLVTLTMAALILLIWVSLSFSEALAQSEGAHRQAGIWQQTQTLLAIDMPQAAPAMASAARASIGRAIVSDRVCVSASAVSRDTLATRLSAVTPTVPTFRWTRLELQGANVKALGADLRGNLTIEGKITPILTDIVAISQTTDPVMGPARRVQRTINARLGPC
jgi:hypothetical protein